MGDSNINMLNNIKEKIKRKLSTDSKDQNICENENMENEPSSPLSNKNGEIDDGVLHTVVD